MRARRPDATGFVVRDGVRIGWERYGDGTPAVLLLPTWSIIHSRHWKLQIADLARRTTVVAFDGRGNGRSDRPPTAAAYSPQVSAEDALAVLDATGTGSAVIVSLSAGAQTAMLLAADHPERIRGAVFIGPALSLGELDPTRDAVREFTEPLPTDEGWAKYNAHAWRRDYRGFLEFFFGEVFCEPHSTKPIEDCVGWGLDTDAETLILTELAEGLGDRARVVELAARISCPVLVIHGTDDRIRPHAHGAELAKLTGGRFVSLTGAGHCPHARDPVRVNLLLREFLRGIALAR